MRPDHPYADVVMVLRAAVEDYPPTVHQANILTEHGLEVGLIDIRYERFANHRPILHERVRRVSVSGWDSLSDGPPSILKRLWNFQKFGSAVSKALARLNPRVVVAFDSSAFYFLGPGKTWPASRRTVVHFHELPELRADLSRGGRRDVQFAIANACHAHLVIFPEPNRAAAFSKTGRLTRQPQIVFNCPRRLDVLPDNRLAKALAERGMKSSKVVLYQGLIGKKRGLHTAIQSMPGWPADTCFVLIGPGDSSAIAGFKRLGAEVGVGDRVVVLPPVSSTEILSFTVGAHIGVSLYEIVGDNERFAASNKLVEYMAVGVPQITSVRDGIGTELEGNWGLAVDPHSAEGIREAVTAILREEQLRSEMARKARNAHLAKYNYEDQFAAVSGKILGWCGKGKAGPDVA
jgi:glycosyltransferase involved in cell wall biosynthesis